MRIVHLEDEPWDSGIAHYCLTLAAEQKRRGDEVWVWGRRLSPVLAEAERLGLPTRGYSYGLDALLELPALRRELSALKPELLNAHTGAAQAMALALAPKGAAVVRTRGDARPPRANALTRLAARRTAGFIAANSALESALARAFPRALVALVPQGIEGPQEPPPLPDGPVAGVLGRLDPVKGHEHALEAARRLKPRLPGLRLLCAGEGELLGRLRWQLGPAGLEGVMSLLGRVPDKWEFIARCRVGVVASTGSEAVSRAALEWMAAGRALVATRVGGLPDLVAHGETGLLVPPGDSAALAQALGELLADPGRAARMGEAARKRWQALYCPEPFYRETSRFYERALHDLPR